MFKNQKKTALLESGAETRKSVTPTARKGLVLGGAAAAFMMMATPAALAETCSPSPAITLLPGGGTITNGGFIAGGVSGTAANIISGIVTAQTAFMLQSTAFVSGPGNPQPDQQGSGVWMRAVGGASNLKAPTTTVVTATTPANAPFNGSATVTCDTAVHSTFAGVQFGHDIVKLNHNGWNIHFGTTAGYLETSGNTIGGSAAGGAFTSTIQTPFAGTYLVVQKGGFFADALLRTEYYQASFNGTGLGVVNQGLSARGITVAASAGYNYAIPNSKWFIEPSAGVIASRTSIDNFNFGGIPDPVVAVAPPGTVKFDDLKSTIGRAGLRTGTTVVQGDWVWQPFAAASIWHEFGKAPVATYFSDHTFIGTPSQVVGVGTGTTIGTYGQYSLGIAGQNVRGWVVFARGDYRKGSQFESWDGTGGVRYHFTPGAPAPVIGKAPPMVASVNWTGFYVGGSAGAVFARDRMTLTGVGGFIAPVVGVNSTDPRGAGFIGGGQVGYNWQFNPQWVGGVEGTLDWTNLNGARECAPLPLFALADPRFGTQPPGYNTTCHFSARYLATFTGRLGYVWGRALWYVKAGGAATRETIEVTCNAVAVVTIGCTNAAGVLIFNPTTATGSLNRLGFTAGYGVEFAMSAKWSARAETSYYNFGTRSVTLSDGVVVSSKLEEISTKIGVNYKLN